MATRPIKDSTPVIKQLQGLIMTGTLFIQLVYIYKSIKVKGYSCIVRFIKPHTSCHPLRKSQYCIEMHWPEQYCDVTRAHVFPDTLYSRLPNSGKQPHRCTEDVLTHCEWVSGVCLVLNQIIDTKLGVGIVFTRQKNMCTSAFVFIPAQVQYQSTSIKDILHKS